MNILNLAKLVVVCLSMALLPLLWLPLYIYKCTVILIVRLFYPEYGRIFTYADLGLEEDLAGERRPKGSLLCSLELEGDLGLEELREIFSRNVLEAGIATNSFAGSGTTFEEKYVTRYPELKQCPTRLMGYTFWRDVEEFNLKEHIYEMGLEKTQTNLSLLHEAVLNRPYLAGNSLWDLILIRNFHEADLVGNVNPDESRTIIIARFHHSMADAKSIMKLLVECLGQQPLNTAQPQPEQVRSYLGFILSYPFNFARTMLALVGPISHCWNHSWKNTLKADVPQIVIFSQKLSLDDMKQVGKKWKGTTSSVILAVICGAMKEVDPEVRRVIAGYVLPKPGHPETLANHAMGAALELPADIESPLERLQTCSQIFREIKESDMGKYFELLAVLIGTGYSPMRRHHIRLAHALFGVPVGITNIAGKRNGFSIGKVACSEVIYSVGAVDSSAGVVFCVSSYKDRCRIAVISSGGVLDPIEVERMASGMGIHTHEHNCMFWLIRTQSKESLYNSIFLVLIPWINAGKVGNYITHSIIHKHATCVVSYQ